MKILALIMALILAPVCALAASGDNFHPCSTVVLSATTSSSSYSLAACGAPTLSVDCHNSGLVEAFIGAGNTTATAVVPNGTASYNSYHICPGCDKVFDLGNVNTIAAITSSSTATIYCTAGFGQ